MVANHYSHNVSVLVGNGDGSFRSPTNYSVGNNPRSVALGDLNDDGKLDWVSANQGGGNITVRLGNGDGSFADVAVEAGVARANEEHGTSMDAAFGSALKCTGASTCVPA